MACKHCHVESSPQRMEMMDFDVAEQCMRIIDNSPEIDTLDLTGGAPELNKAFRWLVEEGRKRNLRIIDRCNLTVLLKSGQEDLGHFLKEHQVNVVASLPCYSEANVRKQRGIGIFGKSILALQHLNSLGYGKDPNLQLDLVFNPSGPSLPPAQPQLQADYKLRLMEDYGIEFNSLYTITNMPIKRSVYLYLYTCIPINLYTYILMPCIEVH
jgi:radical SAM/Cys-rich protein